MSEQEPTSPPSNMTEMVPEPTQRLTTSAALGPTETAKEFLNIILKIMGPEQPSAPLVLLYHKRFLLMLQVNIKNF